MMFDQSVAKGAIRYFPTQEEAQAAADTVDIARCSNGYQDATSVKAPIVREFEKGFAVQLGDYGVYIAVGRDYS